MNYYRLWIGFTLDTIFAIGVFVLGWFVLGLKTGWSISSQVDPDTASSGS